MSSAPLGMSGVGAGGWPDAFQNESAGDAADGPRAPICVLLPLASCPVPSPILPNLRPHNDLQKIQKSI